MTKTTTPQDNCLVKVPHPLVHFPPFFPAQVPQRGFSRTSISEYGDLITVSAPETPRVRELVIFLAALTFFEGVKCEGSEDRIKMTIPGREWRRRAGLGRTARERVAWEQSIKTLAGVQYDVIVGGATRDSESQYKKRETPPPFRRVILTGIFGDVKFHRESDSVTVSILRDFVDNIDTTGLRVSLTHILALRGNIARLLAYVLYGRQSWSGTWGQLAGLAGISEWNAGWKQKQALKTALTELGQNGFFVTTGEEKVKIARKKGLLGGIISV